MAGSPSIALCRPITWSGCRPTSLTRLAACLPVAYGTALRMMVTIGQVKAGEKVLILGASGGVGTCCVQLAKLAGAEVIVCASSADKLARLKDLGADHGIDYTKEDFVKWVYSKYRQAASAQLRGRR